VSKQNQNLTKHEDDYLLPPTEEQMESSQDYVWSLIDYLWEISKERHDLEFASIIYPLFLRCMDIVKDYGWNKDEILKAVDIVFEINDG
tara:strand:+ start:249 stop:515 length:267 start_codon:yes stop_codon:yes gene_type:complete